MTRWIALALLAASLTPTAAAQVPGYTKSGRIDGMSMGTYFSGERVTAAGLEGKVVLVQMAGL